MKRLLTLALMALAVMAYGTAFAAIEGSPHDYKRATGSSTSVYGQCGTCHVPHAAVGAKRLWRVSASAGATTSWADSNVGQLCASCHNGGGIATLHNINNDIPHTVGGTVYAATSHARTMAVLTRPTDSTHASDGLGGAASGQPYTDRTLIECTSCHNVHFEGTFSANSNNRPFLRQTVPGATYGSTSAFCATCHNDRYNNGGVTGASDPATGAGNHPVNIAYTDSALNGGAYFKAIPAALNMPVAANAWSLGGKFEGVHTSPATGTPNIGCQTCHAVHNPASGSDQGNHLLAVNNVAVNAALCETCHGNASGNTARANSGATMEVGTATGDHPIDCAITTADGGPAIDRWYNAHTPAWTVRYERHSYSYDTDGNTWARGTDGKIICTSCHSAHRANTKAVNTIGKLTRQGNTGQTPAGDTGFCVACHADPSPLGHHTHQYNSSSVLDCSNCHGTGRGAVAHNGGFQFNTNFIDGITDNTQSQVCNTCHLYATVTAARAASYAPNGNDAVYGVAGGHLPVDHLGASAKTAGADQTMKSHYLGTFADAGNSINVKRNSWGAFNGFSKFGGPETHGASSDTTGGTLICESCHSVLHNAGTGAAATTTSGYMVNLLLQNYVDDGQGQAANNANAQVGSGLCIACHNQNNVGNNATGPVASTLLEGSTNGGNVNVPAGTHPMTGWSITRAADAGRSTTTLITGTGTYADKPGAPNTASYQDVNKMDCDSCHRPHRAPINSTYDQTKAAGGGAARPVILERQDAANEWSTLCQECHNM